MMIFDADLIAPWVIDRVGLGGKYVRGTASAIGRVRDGKIIGGIYYEDYNGSNIVCHIASDGDRWLNKLFLWMIFDYPFNKLGVKRMTAPILESNKDCINFVEKLGFVREAILQDGHPKGDIYIYTLFKDQCKWHKGYRYDEKHGLVRDCIASD